MPRSASSSARCGPTPLSIRTSVCRPADIEAFIPSAPEKARIVRRALRRPFGDLPPRLTAWLARFAGPMKQWCAFVAAGWWAARCAHGGAGGESPAERFGKARADLVGAGGHRGALVRTPPLL